MLTAAGGPGEEKGGLLRRVAPRMGVVWLGVVSVALLVMSAGFKPDARAYPESPADFVPDIDVNRGIAGGCYFDGSRHSRS